MRHLPCDASTCVWITGCRWCLHIFQASCPCQTGRPKFSLISVSSSLEFLLCSSLGYSLRAAADVTFVRVACCLPGAGDYENDQRRTSRNCKVPYMFRDHHNWSSRQRGGPAGGQLWLVSDCRQQVPPRRSGPIGRGTIQPGRKALFGDFCQLRSRDQMSARPKCHSKARRDAIAIRQRQ